jgi:hypothetical protein
MMNTVHHAFEMSGQRHAHVSELWLDEPGQES